MDITRSDKVLVTGATGMLGRHLVPRLSSRYSPEVVVGVGRDDADLTSPGQVADLLRKTKPTVVIHLAAVVGGIEANRTLSADFLHSNLMMTANLFRAAAEMRVRRFLYPSSGCTYPDACAGALSENVLWDGRPTGTSIGYSMAKKVGMVAAEVYRNQYGLDSVVVIPGGMYGEFDNFRPGYSHVIPALIRRFAEAVGAGASEVVLWGSGRPERDFVYAGDVADCMVALLEQDEEKGPVNISSGTPVTISRVAELIASLTGFKGALAWDTRKPDGQARKILDVGRLARLGLRCGTPLEVGLRKTVEWYLSNAQVSGTVRL